MSTFIIIIGLFSENRINENYFSYVLIAIRIIINRGH